MQNKKIIKPKIKEYFSSHKLSTDSESLKARWDLFFLKCVNEKSKIAVKLLNQSV